jgi:hypothetical protein
MHQRPSCRDRSHKDHITHDSMLLTGIGVDLYADLFIYEMPSQLNLAMYLGYKKPHITIHVLFSCKAKFACSPRCRSKALLTICTDPSHDFMFWAAVLIVRLRYEMYVKRIGGLITGIDTLDSLATCFCGRMYGMAAKHCKVF